jgi:Tfp pilus assembly protein FimV
VALCLAAAVAVPAWAVVSPVGGLSGGSVTPPAKGRVYVARPGDTLWGIATRLDPTGDPRPLVDQMEAELHGGQLQAGQRLILPDPPPG